MKPSHTTRTRNLLLATLLVLALQPARGAAQQTRVDEAAPRGAITGRVTGIGGEPMALVPVHIQSRVAGARFFRMTTTDDEGGFTFGELAPSAYSLTATAPGYVTEQEPAQDAAFGRVYRPGDVVTLRMVKGGVITGRVTDADGEPIVALRVSTFRIRRLDDESPQSSNSILSAATDDRGIYRLYGLSSGVYIVAAGGGSGFFSPYDGDSPTFYPSGTRDTATEISVRAGQEIDGIDIRYSAERGRRVSGTVVTADTSRDLFPALSVALNHVSTGITLNWTGVVQREGEYRFQFNGVADGDYDVRAYTRLPDGDTRPSEPRRITVRGADVTGIKLTLTPLASVSGTLVVEPPPESLRSTELCRDVQPRLPAQEILVAARRDEPAHTDAAQNARQFTRAMSVPDDNGAFTLRNLEAGLYRLEIRPLDESLYTSSIHLPGVAAQPAQAPARGAAQRTQNAPRTVARPTAAGGDNARSHVTLRNGQQLSGVAVRVRFGAAFVAGQVLSHDESEGRYRSFAGVRIYLVPSVAEYAEEILRYSEAAISADGSFAFRNVAPGNYRLVLRRASSPSAETAPPIFLNAEGRASLRREAEAGGHAIELHPCQRLTGVKLEPRPAVAHAGGR